MCSGRWTGHSFCTSSLGQLVIIFSFSLSLRQSEQASNIPYSQRWTLNSAPSSTLEVKAQLGARATIPGDQTQGSVCDRQSGSGAPVPNSGFFLSVDYISDILASPKTGILESHPSFPPYATLSLFPLLSLSLSCALCCSRICQRKGKSLDPYVIQLQGELTAAGAGGLSAAWQL